VFSDKEEIFLEIDVECEHLAHALRVHHIMAVGLCTPQVLSEIVTRDGSSNRVVRSGLSLDRKNVASMNEPAGQ
jgi:hypothetical protein